jgi:hypothetical protein
LLGRRNGRRLRQLRHKTDLLQLLALLRWSHQRELWHRLPRRKLQQNWPPLHLHLHLRRHLELYGLPLLLRPGLAGKRTRGPGNHEDPLRHRHLPIWHGHHDRPQEALLDHEGLLSLAHRPRCARLLQETKARKLVELRRTWRTGKDGLSVRCHHGCEGQHGLLLLLVLLLLITTMLLLLLLRLAKHDYIPRPLRPHATIAGCYCTRLLQCQHMLLLLLLH